MARYEPTRSSIPSIVEGSGRVTAGVGSHLKCVELKVPSPSPILAYGRSTSNLSSYKSLYLTNFRHPTRTNLMTKLSGASDIPEGCDTYRDR